MQIKAKKSNLQKGREIVARFMYIARSDIQLSSDIENLTYADFNVKYNMNVSSEFNFQKNIYRLYNTYLKRAKKNSTDEYYKLLIRYALEKRKQKKKLTQKKQVPKYPHHYRHNFIDGYGRQNTNTTTINFRRNVKNIAIFSNDSTFYMTDPDVSEMIYLRDYFLSYISSEPQHYKNHRFFFIIYTSKSNAAISSPFLFSAYNQFKQRFIHEYETALMKICQSDEFAGAYIEFSCF